MKAHQLIPFIAVLVSPAIAAAEITEIHQRVFGMDCLPCSKAVHAVVERIPGVESVEVSMRLAGADIRLAPDNHVTIAQLRAAIRKASYDPRDAQIRAIGRLEGEKGALILQFSTESALPLQAGPFGCVAGERVVVTGSIAEWQDDGPLTLTSCELLSLDGRRVVRAANSWLTVNRRRRAERSGRS